MRSGDRRLFSRGMLAAAMATAGGGGRRGAAGESEHSRYAPEAPLMLEHLKEEAEYDAARDEVRAAGARVGVGFD